MRTHRRMDGRDREVMAFLESRGRARALREHRIFPVGFNFHGTDQLPAARATGGAPPAQRRGHAFNTVTRVSICMVRLHAPTQRSDGTVHELDSMV